MRSLVYILAVFAVTGCHFAEYVSPGKDDTTYPCHDEHGERRADMVDCRPYDGSRTCCFAGQVCAPDRCDAEQVVGPAMSARRSTPRVKQ